MAKIVGHKFNIQLRQSKSLHKTLFLIYYMLECILFTNVLRLIFIVDTIQLVLSKQSSEN